MIDLGLLMELLVAATPTPTPVSATSVEAGLSTAEVLALVAPTVILLVGLFTVLQRSKADRQAEWWRRVQWSADRALEDDVLAQTVGVEVLTALGRSKFSQKDRESLELYRTIRRSLSRLRTNGSQQGPATNVNELRFTVSPPKPVDELPQARDNRDEDRDDEREQ